jgi:hypothetical protein
MMSSSPYAWFNLFGHWMLHGVRELHVAVSDPLLEKDFGHHAFVLMTQQMTVEER